MIGHLTEGEVSVCIEKADLKPIHLEIKLKEPYNYVIIDWSDMEGPGTPGTYKIV